MRRGSHEPVDFEVLSQYFHLPITEVAKTLGICATALKKICRKNGIPRWPARKVRSLDNMIASLQETLVQKPDDEKTMKEIERLKLKRMELINNPSLAISNGEKRVSKSSTRPKKSSKDKEYSSSTLDAAVSLSNASIGIGQHDPNGATSNSIWHDYSNSPHITLGMQSIFLPPHSLTLPPPNPAAAHPHVNPLSLGVPGPQSQQLYMYIYDQQPLMEAMNGTHATTHGHLQLNEKVFPLKRTTFPSIVEMDAHDNHSQNVNGGQPMMSQQNSKIAIVGNQEVSSSNEAHHLVSGWDYTLS